MSATDATQQANRAEMDPRRLVVVAYLVFGVVLGLFLGHMLELLFAQLNVKNTELLDGSGVPRSMALGFVLAVGLGAWSWTNPKSNAASLEIATELMKVTWPTFDETRTATLAVVVASLLAAIILFGIDTLSYKLMVDWLPIVWGKL